MVLMGSLGYGNDDEQNIGSGAGLVAPLLPASTDTGVLTGLPSQTMAMALATRLAVEVQLVSIRRVLLDYPLWFEYCLWRDVPGGTLPKRRFQFVERVSTSLETVRMLARVQPLLAQLTRPLHLLRHGHLPPAVMHPPVGGKCVLQVRPRHAAAIWRHAVGDTVGGAFGRLPWAVCGCSYENRSTQGESYATVSLRVVAAQPPRREELVDMCERLRDHLPERLRVVVDSARYVEHSTGVVTCLY